jgi:hypothetical protein
MGRKNAALERDNSELVRQIIEMKDKQADAFNSVNKIYEEAQNVK